MNYERICDIQAEWMSEWISRVWHTTPYITVNCNSNDNILVTTNHTEYWTLLLLFSSKLPPMMLCFNLSLFGRLVCLSTVSLKLRYWANFQEMLYKKNFRVTSETISHFLVTQQHIHTVLFMAVYSCARFYKT